MKTTIIIRSHGEDFPEGKNLQTMEEEQDLTAEVEGTQYSPADCGEAEIEWEKVLAALQTLPLDRREVLILRFVYGLRYNETAAILGKSGLYGYSSTGPYRTFTRSWSLTLDCLTEASAGDWREPRALVNQPGLFSF